MLGSVAVGGAYCVAAVGGDVPTDVPGAMVAEPVAAPGAKPPVHCACRAATARCTVSSATTITWPLRSSTPMRAPALANCCSRSAANAASRPGGAAYARTTPVETDCGNGGVWPATGPTARQEAATASVVDRSRVLNVEVTLRRRYAVWPPREFDRWRSRGEPVAGTRDYDRLTYRPPRSRPLMKTTGGGKVSRESSAARRRYLARLLAGAGVGFIAGGRRGGETEGRMNAK